MSAERIDKILSSQNIASRSEIKAMIKSGRISADGLTVKRPEQKFDPENTVFCIDEKEITFKKHLYIMMNKPAGVLSASNDKYAKTVIDLLPDEMKRRGLFPAGRLDKDTEGLLIITDDGDLAHKMLAPKSHVFKLYEATTDKVLNSQDIEAFKSGIKYGDNEFLPADMRIIGEKTALVEICEGKFHQVKKMFNAVGANVLYLKRLRIGGVYLDENLKSGEVRELTDEEIMSVLSHKQEI